MLLETSIARTRARSTRVSSPRAWFSTIHPAIVPRLSATAFGPSVSLESLSASPAEDSPTKAGVTENKRPATRLVGRPKERNGLSMILLFSNAPFEKSSHRQGFETSPAHASFEVHGP